MKQLLIIQHESKTTAGSTLEWALQRNIDVQFWRPAEMTAPPSVNDVADGKVGVIICGGTMDTFQEDLFPWLKIEKRFLQNAIKAQVKCFGLCLGAQLLAEAIGGRVLVQQDWELGFTKVTEQLRPDQAPNGLTVFEWHHCTFEIPKSAELFVTGSHFRNQAFRVGQQIMATQFHPEATEEWIRQCAERLQPNHVGNVQSKEAMLASISKVLPGLQRWYFAQLDRFFLQDS
jgi:GMP synthase-like glutamine amidotransferase